ncbi:MAG: acetylornithine transaminase [Thermodesulfovibrio sp.]|jgi:predicted acetylornithine/succinylornithine family transaminase|uniref:acetylornithine transaminase n=1 Tax=unclassified Thermodesulfovibrio TaxID=2645936 RepID=UPI00083AD098|nr:MULTISPECIES: acetylornithine transaminase [unclassified Thermodesulfovibrio]MDI1472325.1 acetylornithine transaminase [Thermodesulfovibrio sp. 1176]MDI6714190.1 acetylornithine transaminase [Thermodesulfovibrio sp.]ODA43509.1 Acetylornithine aminotransferase [Thermodesulfovibrio sp. N1]
MEDREIIAKTDKLFMPTYARYPIVLRKGRGVRVWDVNGKEYIDFLAGIAVNVLGHCPRKVVMVIQKQAQRLIHVSNLYYTEPQLKLAEILIKNSFADRVFLCNSGTEANEGALKLARIYMKNKFGNERYEFISAKNSFHGRSFGSLSVTGQEKYHYGFEPLLEGVRFVPFNDAKAIENAISDKTCAVILEPIQAEGGIYVPDKDYLRKVREICDKNGILLIFDEVQTGIGRTGKLFAYEHYGIEPDIMTLAKGLGGGIPIGAILAKDEIAQAFVPKTHASTFGGNPVACAAAVATLETILEDGYLLEYCQRISKYFFKKLNTLKEKYSEFIKEIRGLGLLIGVEFLQNVDPLVKKCMEKGLLVGTAGNGSVLRFTPPLIIEKDDIDEAISILDKAIKEGLL